MSRSVDERIVALHFENQEFEKGAKDSIKTLEELKKSLDFNGVGESFEQVSKATKNGFGLQDTTKQTNLFTKALKGLGNVASYPFQALNAGISQFNSYLRTYLGFDLAGKLVNTARQVTNAFTIDPMRTGWNEYELKMDSIKTIMSGTEGEYRKILADQYTEEAHLEVVKDRLEQLNKYADETIYSFQDMTSNIGKFTNNGVALDKAVSAMKGISNAAAKAGQGTNQASMAMYNLSQAIGVGKLTTIDWKSIENANMATLELKNSFIDVAKAMGKVKEKEGKIYALDKNGNINKKAEITAENFRNTLSEGWADSDVIVATLAAYSGDYNLQEFMTEFKITNKEVAAQLLETGKAAKKAATEVRTFSKMFDALKEAAQSGWAFTWELIFGDMKEGSTFWTELNDKFSKMLNDAAEKRNDLLRGWRGEVMNVDRQSMVDAIQNWFDEEETGFNDKYNTKKWMGTEVGIPKIVDEVIKKFDESGGTTSKAINELVTYLGTEFEIDEADARKIIGRIAEDYNKLDYLGKDGRDYLTKGINNIIDSFMNLKDVFTSIKTSIFGETTASGLQTLTKGFQDVTLKIKTFTQQLKNGKTFEALKNIFGGLVSVFNALWGSAKKVFSLLGSLLGPVGAFLLNIFSEVGAWLSKISGETIAKTIGKIRDRLKGLTKVKIAEWFKKTTSSIGSFFKTVGTTIVNWLKGNGYEALANALTKAWTYVTTVWNKVKSWTGWAAIGSFFGDIWGWIETQASTVGKAFSKGENGEPSLVGQWITSAYETVKGAWDSIVGWPGWKTIGEFVSGIVEWIRKEYGIVKKYFVSDTDEPSLVASWITTAKEKIESAWNIVADLPLWETLGQFFGDIWGWISSKFKQKGTSAKPLNKNPNKMLFEYFDEVEEASTAENKISKFSQVINDIKNVIESAEKLISEAWIAVSGWPGWEEIGGFFGDIWSWIVVKAGIIGSWFEPSEEGPSAVSSLITNAKTVVESAWNKVYKWPGWKEIGSFFSNLWSWIYSKARKLIKAFEPSEEGPSAVSEFISNAKETVEGTWNKISKWPGWREIGSFFSNIFSWMVAKAKRVASFFTAKEDGPSEVSTFISNAKETVEGIWNDVSEWPGWKEIGRFFGDVWSWIVDKAGVVASWFEPTKEGPSKIVQWINQAKADVSKAWLKVKSWTGWKEIGNFFSDIWSWILSLFSGGSKDSKHSSKDFKSQIVKTSNVISEGFEEITGEVQGTVLGMDGVVLGINEWFGPPQYASAEQGVSLIGKFLEFINTNILTPIGDALSKFGADIGFDTYIEMIRSVFEFLTVFMEFAAKIITLIANRLTKILDSNAEGHVSAIFKTIGDILAVIAGRKLFEMVWSLSGNKLSGARIASTFLQDLGKFLTGIGVALMGVAAAVYFLGKMDTASLVQGMVAVAVLLAATMYIIKQVAEKWKADQVATEDHYVAEGLFGLGQSLIKWGGILGAIAIAMEQLPEIIESMSGTGVTGKDIFEILAGLTLFIGGIILVTAIASKIDQGTTSDLTDIGGALVSMISMLAVVAISMALLPGIIDALGRNSIAGNDIFQALSGLAIFVGGMALVLGALAKLDVDPFAMVKVALGLSLSITVFLGVMVGFLRGLEGLFNMGSSLDDGEGLVAFVDRMGNLWQHIKTAFGGKSTDANGEAVGGVTEAISDAAGIAKEIDIEGLYALKESIGVTKEITDALQSWAAGYKFGSTYEDFKSELGYITDAINAFSKDASKIAQRYNMNDLLQVGKLLEELMMVANLAQLLEAMGSEGGADFTWFKFAASLQDITDSLANANGANDLKDSIYNFASFAEMVQGAIDDASTSIDVTPLITKIAEGIVNPNSRRELALAFQQLGNDISNKSGVSGETITKIGESGTKVDLSGLNIFQGLFDGIDLDSIFGDFKVGNIKNFIDPTGEGLGMETFFGFKKEDITEMFKSGFDIDAIKASIVGEDGQGGLDLESLVKDSNYTDAVNDMITKMQSQLDSGDYSLTVTTVGDWADTDLPGDGSVTMDGVVTINSGDITSITNGISQSITANSTRIVNSVASLNGRIAGLESAIRGMSIVLDTGALAGAINDKLGQMVGPYTRGLFKGPS